MKYQLLALDIDGTLIGPDQIVPPDTVAAIADARAAGIRVVLATGRVLGETLPVWRQLGVTGPCEPLVLSSGAQVSEPDTRRTLFHQPVDRLAAQEFAEALAAEGLSTVAAVDSWRCGFDFCIAESRDVATLRRDWFEKAALDVRPVGRFHGNGEAPTVLRLIGVCPPEQASPLLAALQERFAGRLHMRAIRAINYGLMLIEAFAPEVDKLAGLAYVGQAWRIAPARMAAVGDDCNDLGMIRGCGLGVASPHATDEVRAAADHIAETGLAQFIRELIDGRFG